MALFFNSMAASGAAFRMRAQTDRLFQHLNNYLSRHELGVEASWLPVLFCLQDGDSKSIGQMALEIGYSHVAIVKLVKAMTAAGWLEVFVDPNDRRKKMISIQDQAADRLGQLLALLKQYDAVLADWINKEAKELKVFKSVLFSHN